MATIPIKVLLFVFGAAVAGLGTAYFAGALDPWLGTEQQMEVANQTEVPSSTVETGKSDRPAAGPASSDEEAGDAVAQADEDGVIVPVFDIVRAEPDGSLVVAGNAAPNAEVEILSGSSVLATTQAGPSGDFAAVLDGALEPGDHNIVLRSTTDDDVVATSEQTAIVSVPSEQGGDVVALVQQPGEPSRLISVPEARSSGEPAGEKTEPATGAGAPAAEAQQAAEETLPAGKPEDTVASGHDTATGQSDEKASVENPNEPAGGRDTAQGGAPLAAGAEALPEGSEEAAEPGAEAGMRVPQTDQPSTEAEPSSAPFIEAVEIDGRQIFVAGRAEPGRTVRIYVNDTLLGQTKATPTGRFLVETERDLPVGDYIVRADVLDDDGTVIARAAVPFQRESGEKIAAVAPPRPPVGVPPAVGSDKSGAANTAPNGGAADAGGTGSVEKPRDQAAGDADEPAPRDNPMSSAQTDANMQAGQGDAGGDGVVVSQKLEPVDGAVIIRRGDTLWHISRRVYGQGIRYTTIYLANQDQIRDPDLIWPGQVFALPEETDEGEKADLSAIGDQAVEPAEGDKAAQ